MWIVGAFNALVMYMYAKPSMQISESMMDTVYSRQALCKMFSKKEEYAVDCISTLWVHYFSSHMTENVCAV